MRETNSREEATEIFGKGSEQEHDEAQKDVDKTDPGNPIEHEPPEKI